MNKNICFVCLLIIAACSHEKPIPSVQGKLNNSAGETIYLIEMSPKGMLPIDTATLDEKGFFAFHYKITHPGFYEVKLSEKNFATVVLDSLQQIMITGDARDLANTYATEGSADSKLFVELNNFFIANYKKRDSITTIYQNHLNGIGDSEKNMDSLNTLLETPFNKLIEEQNIFLKDFIRKNSGSLVSIAAIQQLTPDENIETYESLNEGLSTKYPTSSYVRLFSRSVENMKRLAIGAEAPEIVLDNAEGKEISLSSLRGKFVLIDFWASWCKPCRAENPEVVKAYKKFRKNGFEIYSVSLDKEKDKWTEAVKADNMEWIQVSDLKYPESPVMKLYGIKSIPSNFLIDKEGKIIAKNLFGEQLEEKLCKLIPSANNCPPNN